LYIMKNFSIGYIFFLFFLFSPLFPHIVYGQVLDALGIAEIYPLGNIETLPGDIISISRATSTSAYARADTSSGASIVGVVVEEPLILFQTTTVGVPVVQTGQARVRVSTINGSISTGDFITASDLPGQGQKAESNATHIVGIALESFPGAAGTSTAGVVEIRGNEVYTGTILVDLKIGFISGAGVTSVDLSSLERFDDTRTAIQIIVAAILALGSIFFAFRNLGSSIQTGILSIGRNPRAKIAIQTTVLLNLFFVLAISGAGVLLGFIILSVPFF